jgi:hypothetical protein
MHKVHDERKAVDWFAVYFKQADKDEISKEFSNILCVLIFLASLREITMPSPYQIHDR